MRCGIYLRVSKEEKTFSAVEKALSSGEITCGEGAAESESESNSISGQRMVIKEFVDAHSDMEIAGEWCDDGYSGITFARVR